MGGSKSLKDKFGVVAFLFYLKHKLLKLGEIGKAFLPGVRHPVYLRSKTSDVSAFRQIFVHKEYNINFEFQPETIIDAGGNIGLAAVYFANRFPKARIITIESEQSNFDLLEKNVSPYPNIIPYKRAISNLAGQFINVVDKGFGKWGAVTETGESSQGGNVIDSVETISVDKIILENNLDIIDIFKIDIEGAEKELFASNFENWLPKTRCLIIELHDDLKKGASKNFFNAVSKFDFSFYAKGENLVFNNTNEKIRSSNALNA